MILGPDGQPIADVTTEEAQIVQRMAWELEAITDPMEIALRPITALHLAGLLQLALRHPGVNGSNLEAATAFLYAVRSYFVGCPATLEILDRGDDPSQDVLP